MPLPLAVLAIPAVASALGSILGRSSQGAAQERSAQNAAATGNYQTRQQALLSALMAQGREKMDAYGTQQGATSNMFANRSAEGIQRARLGLDSASERARQSVLGSLMKNLQPTSVAGPAGQRGHETKISGGLSAAALDPMSREHGSALMKAALQAQLSGSDVPAASDWQASVLDVPEATDYSKGVLNAPEYQRAGRGESLMSGLGSVMSGIGAVGGAFTNAAGRRMTVPASVYDDQQYGWAGRNG